MLKTVLFDLKNDPFEINNLVAAENYKDTIVQLDTLLTEHMRRTGDDWGIEAVFPPNDFETHAEGHERAQQVLAEAIVEQ